MTTIDIDTDTLEDLDFKAALPCEVIVYEKRCGNVAEYILRAQCPRCKTPFPFDGSDGLTLLCCSPCWSLARTLRSQLMCSFCGFRGLHRDYIFIASTA